MKKTLYLVLCTLLVTTMVGSALAEDAPSSFTESLSASTSLTMQSPQKRATSLAAVLTFYNNRAAFEAAVPGVPTETFESGLVGPGGVIGCPSPLSSATPGTCFPPGGLLDGFAYTASGGINVALGAGVVGNPTTAIAADLFTESATISFSNPDVLAVGFDLFEPFGSAVTISVYSADGLEGQTIVGPGGGFFGVTSDTDITAIEVGTIGANSAEVIDNLSFGEGCPCGPTNSLFSDFINGQVPVMSYLQCKDNPDHTGVLVMRTDGSIAGAFAGTRGGPLLCGTQVGNDPPTALAVTPGEDAACRAALRAVCPD